jgi:hypothetical protein
MKHIVLAATLLFVSAASAQEFRSTMSGRVTDPTGAVIPRAAVLVTNTDTGQKVATQTDKAGVYTAPFLLPGKYSVQIKAPGFESYLHDGITIQTGARVEEDAALTVGAATEEVRVTLDAPLVELSTATAGQVLSAEEIEDLPANGRSPLAMAKTEYGVIPKQKNSLSTTRPFDNGASSDFSIGGGNSQSNEYLLNGVPNEQDSSRLPGFSPQLDSVDQVRVDVFESDASYGDTSGGTVNLTTKAGTNRYHGTASEFNEFSAINAPNRWFVPVTNIAPATRQNQYGFTFGGPVRIPHLYNGSDHLFFFYSYERFKDSVNNPVTTTVPTAAERTGDFSALLAIGSGYQLYSPFGATANAKGVVTRNPFAGNILPQALLNPVAKAYLQYFPLPNVTGSVDGQSNYFSNNTTRDDYNSHSGRLDYSINDRNKLFGETHRSEYKRNLGNLFNNISTGTFTYDVYSGGILDYVHTFSASLTMDNRLSLTRTYVNNTLASQGFDVTSIGYPGYLAANSTLPVLPRIVFSDANGSKVFNSLSGTVGNREIYDTFQYFGGITKSFGRHTLKIGPDIRLNKYSSLTPGSPSGAFTFGTTFVSATSSAAAPTFGGSFADFLLGTPTAGTQTIAQAYLYNTWYSAGYLQDDWRLSTHLTLNLGLRLEHETGITESNNRAVVGFDPTLPNSATAAATARYSGGTQAPEVPVSSLVATGGVLYADGARRTEYTPAPIYVSPRFGLAFSPTGSRDQSVFRAGIGVFDNPFNDYNTPQNYGYSATTALVATTNNNLSPASSLSDPFPTATNPIQLPTGNALGVNTNLGSNIAFRNPDVKVPYAIRYYVDFQQQLTRNTMIEIGYLGAHQVHLSYSNNLSAVGDYPYLSKSHRLDPANNTFLNTTFTNPFYKAPGETGSLASSQTLSRMALLQNSPAYSSVTQQLIPAASAKFNELLVRFHLRPTAGTTLNVNYEWSHNLTTGQLTPGGPLSYQGSTSDYPTHLSITGTYALPFGQGKRYLHSSHLVDAFVGGFSVDTIYALLSGTPIQWGNVDFSNGNTYGSPLKLQPRNITSAFNTSIFYTGNGQGAKSCVTPIAGVACDPTDTGQASNSQNVRTFPTFYGRQDRTNNLDFSVIKAFHFGERVRLQYRFEAFNLLNHTQYGAPSVAPTAVFAITSSGPTGFGTISSQANLPRILQQGLRLVF